MLAVSTHPNSNNAITPAQLIAAIKHLQDYLLTTAEAAAILSLPEDWLADARQGRKTMSGPQYVKLGEGRTASIRYRNSDLQDWIKQLQPRTHTADLARYARCSTYQSFIDDGMPADRWLYVIDDTTVEAVEFFGAVQSGMWPGRGKLRWIPHSDAAAGRLIATNGLRLPVETVKWLRQVGGGDLAAGIIRLAPKA